MRDSATSEAGTSGPGGVAGTTGAPPLRTAAPGDGATIVVRFRVVPGREEAFGRWQQELTQAVSAAPGFVEQSMMPPSPPLQAHWVALQWFARTEDAVGWLSSRRRHELSKAAQPILLGPEDIHIAKDGQPDGGPAPASAMISTRVKPGAEEAYRAWQHRIAAALVEAPGFQGYRFEPPIEGVQDKWLAVARFDSDAHLRAWLDSPVRLALLEEVEPLTDERSARTVRTGFEQWFESAEQRPAAWKMNMLVIVALYPLAFLSGQLLMLANGMPGWLATFIGNVFCVLMLAVAVPFIARRFTWWLAPGDGTTARRVTLLGAAAAAGLYLLWLAVFAAYSTFVPPL